MPAERMFRPPLSLLGMQGHRGTDNVVKEAVAASTAVSAASLPAPRAASELKAACRKLQGQPSELAAYIASLPPASYRKVLKSELDSEILGAFATALQQRQASEPAWCRAALQALQGVDRYKMTSTMAPTVTREALAALQQAVA